MINGSFNIQPTELLLTQKGLNKIGEVQKVVDSECMRYMEPYIPKRTGVLINSMLLSTVIGSGEINIKTKYAHYMHEGIVYVSPTTGSPFAKRNEVKVPTTRKLTYIGAPMRGRKFFDRMKADHRNDILKAAQKVLNGVI